jgi:hypothetical protein
MKISRAVCGRRRAESSRRLLGQLPRAQGIHLVSKLASPIRKVKIKQAEPSYRAESSGSRCVPPALCIRHIGMDAPPPSTCGTRRHAHPTHLEERELELYSWRRTSLSRPNRCNSENTQLTAGARQVNVTAGAQAQPPFIFSRPVLCSLLAAARRLI